VTTGDPLLARNWRKSKVLRCHDGKEKMGLVCFLRERYAERFFEPITHLTGAPSSEHGYGFAIMSLCCLLIETIECYRLGWPSSHPAELRALEALPQNLAAPEPYYKLQRPFEHQFSSELAFEKFFDQAEHCRHFGDMKGKGREFYRAIRCGLLHQAQTKDGWRILTHGKCWDDAPDQRTINRNKFSRLLKQCFDELLEQLEARDWDEEPWKSTRKKIWWLAQTS